MAHGCTVGGATNDKSQIQLDFDTGVGEPRSPAADGKQRPLMDGGLLRSLATGGSPSENGRTRSVRVGRPYSTALKGRAFYAPQMTGSAAIAIEIHIVAEGHGPPVARRDVLRRPITPASANNLSANKINRDGGAAP